MNEMDQMQRSAKKVSRAWIALHSKEIERLAIQYGRNAEDAASVTEETCRQIYSEETFTQNEDELLPTLYQIAIMILLENREVGLEDSSLLPFEEDDELHQLITQLNPQIKISFILSEFHGFNEDEISKIIGKSLDEIKQSIGAAHLLLSKRIGTSLLNKRLDFLRKSYSRIQLNFNIEQVFRRKQIENIKLPSRNLKLKLLFWIAGILGILILCIVTILTSEEFQQASAEKYIEELRESFENELSSKLNELGITDLSIEEQNMYRFSYIFIARDQFDEFIGMLNQQKDQIRSNKKEIHRRYQDILLSLQLPSDMVTSLLANPLTDDLEKSEAFINQFFQQHDVIRELYLMRIYGLYQHLVTEIVDNQIDFQDLLVKKDALPIEFQELLEGMSKQNFEIISMQKLSDFYPSFKKSEYTLNLRQSLHDDVGGYITLLESEPFYLYPNLAYSLEDTVSFIRDFEKALLATNPQENVLHYGSPYFYLSNTYHELLFQIVIGEKSETIFGPDGVVKSEFQTAWKTIASFDGNSPSAFIMREIVNEMEANQWKESKKYTQVFYGDHFHLALEMARSGNLNDFVWEPFNESGNMTVFLDDPRFNKVVGELYREFSIEHDLTLLGNALPLQVFGLYELANQLEDPVTMWHLLDHNNIPLSLEEFVEGWKQHTPLAEVAVRLFVEVLGEEYNDSPILSLGYQNKNTTSYFARMISDREKFVWLVYDVPIIR